MLRDVPMTPTAEWMEYKKFGYAITRHKQALCPACKSALNAGPNYMPNFCADCGQRLQWKDWEGWEEDQTIGYDTEEARRVIEEYKARRLARESQSE